MNEKFSLKLVMLDMRIQKVIKVLDSLSVDRLEREFNTINSHLMSLLEFAAQHEVNITEHHSQIVSIGVSIEEVKDHLEYKKLPRWKKLFATVLGAIDLSARLLGITTNLKGYILGESKLLTYDSSIKIK